MKAVKDKFSHQSESYKKFRPVYPPELYDVLLQWVKHRHQCWDCGTGNGQVAVELSRCFDKVFATDISEKQLKQAEARSNIIYSQQRAEQTSFKTSSFDLITVGQAVHWFDIPAFSKEVRRVAKSGGILSIWGYGLLRVSEAVNDYIDDFYNNIIGRYWDAERKHIDDKYNTIDLDFEEISSEEEMSIRLQWDINQLRGYLDSWSAVQNYRQKNPEDPVELLVDRLKEHWPEGQSKELGFPLFMKIFRVEK